MANKRRRSTPRRNVVLRARGLTKSYGDLLALAPLNLDVTAGQVVAIVGHNGSGKSTLLELIAGLLDPTDGSVAVAGHPAGTLGARAALTYIGDSPVLYDDLSVWEHLEYLGRLRGLDDWERRGRALLDDLGLTHRADDLPTGFSRGLRQKAALAVGFVSDARVVLVDEPFVGLDAVGKRAFLGLVDERRRQGTTILVATHDPDVLAHVDRCVALREGVVVHDGSPVASDVPGLARGEVPGLAL